MTRVATSFALASWLGFHAVTGLTELANAAGVSGAGLALGTAGGSGPLAALFVGGLTLGTSAVAGLALFRLHSRDPLRVRSGERLAFASIGISSAMVIAAALFGAPFAAVFERVDLAFWSLGLSLLALAFDHAMLTADDPEDELAYRKALVAIERSTPRRDERRSGDEERR